SSERIDIRLSTVHRSPHDKCRTLLRLRDRGSRGKGQKIAMSLLSIPSNLFVGADAFCCEAVLAEAENLHHRQPLHKAFGASRRREFDDFWIPRIVEFVIDRRQHLELLRQGIGRITEQYYPSFGREVVVDRISLGRGSRPPETGQAEFAKRL